MNKWIKKLPKNQDLNTLPFQRSMIIAFVLSLSIGFLDIIAISILHKPPIFSSFLFVLPSLASTISLFFLTYVLLWFLIISHIGRRLNAERISLFFSLGAFLLMIFLLFSSKQIYFSFSLNDVGFFLLCFLASTGIYFMIRAIVPTSCYRNNAAFLGVAIPFVLAETVLLIWYYSYGTTSSFPSPHSFRILIGYILAVLLTVGILYRIGQTISLVERIITVFMILVVISPISLLLTLSKSKTSSQEFKRKEHQIKHVILITDDTLRPDFLSCYDPQGATPSIDQLAEDGILFTQAISAAPWTLPAVASIMTGLSPSVHKARTYHTRLPEYVRTLAEYMRDDGYYTAALGQNKFLTSEFNVSQGFLAYNFFPKIDPWKDSSFSFQLLLKRIRPLFSDRFRSEASTGVITELALNWLESNYDKNFFLWLHYFDPHQPYTPTKDLIPNKTPPPSIGNTFGEVAEIRGGHFVPSLEEREWIKTLYKAEVRHVDQNIGRLLKALKQLQLYDEALIIFTSDHGEEFWEHDGYEHGHTLYKELLWVPLIIKLPLSTSKQQIDSLVMTSSITPTILDLCKIDYERDYLSADSLSSSWESDPPAFDEQPAISTGLLYYEDRESVMFDGLKYIHSLLTNREELYDLSSDPEEQVSVVSSFPDKVWQAKNILENAKKRTKELAKHYRTLHQEEIQLDDDTIQQLKSLGYIR